MFNFRFFTETTSNIWTSTINSANGSSAFAILLSLGATQPNQGSSGSLAVHCVAPLDE